MERNRTKAKTDAEKKRFIGGISCEVGNARNKRLISQPPVGLIEKG
jgi:hypothetical protein